MNIHGQTKLPTIQQLQIQDFLNYNKIDILNLQESDISERTNLVSVILYCFKVLRPISKLLFSYCKI